MLISAYILFIFLGIAAIFDLFSRRVPNYWTGIGAGIGMAAPWLGGYGVSLASAYLGGVFAFGIFFFPYLFGWMGAGDVKLFGVTGLFLGLERIVTTVLCIALSGGVLAVLYLVMRLFNSLVGRKSRLRAAADRGLPYAVAIFIGTAWTLLGAGEMIG